MDDGAQADDEETTFMSHLSFTRLAGHGERARCKMEILDSPKTAA